MRVNQIYEQAKWSIITEHVQCNEEEMVLFAGLQVGTLIIVCFVRGGSQYNTHYRFSTEQLYKRIMYRAGQKTGLF